MQAQVALLPNTKILLGNVWNKKITVPKAPNFASKSKAAAASAASKTIKDPKEVAKRHKLYPKSDAQTKGMKPNKEIETMVIFWFRKGNNIQKIIGWRSIGSCNRKCGIYGCYGHATQRLDVN